MLTGLKVSSLVCNCVFYRPLHNANWRPHRTEMQELNMQTDRARRVNEKNGAICLVIMLIPRVMVFKVSKITHSLYFLLRATKN